MKTVRFCWVVCFLLGFGLSQVNGQDAASNRLQFNAFLVGETGQPLTGPQSVTFSLYKDQLGGAAIWMETQNVICDEKGHFVVMLGEPTPGGIPLDFFVSGTAQWLGFRPGSPGQFEQRVFLVSVPYAFKAKDAETLGGIPRERFVLKDSTSWIPTTQTFAASNSDDVVFKAPGGSENHLLKYDAAGNPMQAGLIEVNGNIGIGIAAADNMNSLPDKLYVNGSVRVGNDKVFGFESTTPGVNAGRFYASTANDMIFETNQASNSMLFQTTGGKVGVGTTTPEARLDVAVNDTTAYTPTITGTPSFAAQPYDAMAVHNPNNSANFASMFFSTRTAGTGTGRIALVQDGVRGAAFSFLTRNSIDFDQHEWMRITNIGRVGIGTATPQALLDVNGAVKAVSFAGDGSALTNLPAGTPTDVACAAACISTAEIVDSAVTTVKIAALGVTTAKIADSAVNSVKIADLSIVDADISPSAAISSPKLSDQARTRGITYLAGCANCSVLTDSDDQATIYYNVVGDMTVKSITCFSDVDTTVVNPPTAPTINIKRIAVNGTSTDVLASAISCTKAGVNVSAGFNVATILEFEKLDFELVSAGITAKTITLSIKTWVVQ